MPFCSLPVLTWHGTVLRRECIQKSLNEETWFELLAPLIHGFFRSGNFCHLTTAGTQYRFCSDCVTTGFCVFCQTFSTERMITADSTRVFKCFHADTAGQIVVVEFPQSIHLKNDQFLNRLFILIAQKYGSMCMKLL